MVAADDASKRVKIISGGVELIEVTPTAPKCGKQKGETIRLRVTSETAIDVRIYVITVCDNADQNCPILRAIRNHWSVDDPAR